MEIGSVAIGDARDICVATKWRLWRHLVAAFLLYVGIGVLPDVVPTATPLCWPNTRKVILLVKGKQIESWFIKLLINDYEIIIKKFWLNNYLNNQPWNYILVGLVEISPCNLVFRALPSVIPDVTPRRGLPDFPTRLRRPLGLRRPEAVGVSAQGMLSEVSPPEARTRPNWC